MSFIDKASVIISAGDGGDGIVSWRHEIYVDKGGPDGGDGGDGGDVVFVASRNQNTLASFRYQRELKAKPGAKGGQSRKHGRNGLDLEVAVPVGTAVIAQDGTVLADLVEDGQRAIIAHGGKGGFGNAHFISSVRQTPKIAEKGEPGSVIQANLELKMIADVGLVGLPNAGKSTFLSVVSNATPEIADYPFTTLTPNLGVATVDKETHMLIADIPGIIEGAAEGKGLGVEFLRHVERTAVLLHLIDSYEPDVIEAYQTIQTELKAYKIDLSSKPQVVALTKIEGLDDDIIQDQMEKLRTVIPEGTPLFAISAPAHTNIKELLRQLSQRVAQERARVIAEFEEEGTINGVPVLTLKEEQLAWKVKKVDKYFLVTGHKIEKFASRTDFENESGVQRLRDIMKKMGIMHELVRQGIKPEDRILIDNKGELEY
ncbi:MAG: GTPase ObgE [Candidatus Saccharibacteria bacterium]